jgi:CheY-like chemotaxis protein/anti-sigma regulatory factor (Ser/Thr protein kinase)
VLAVVTDRASTDELPQEIREDLAMIKRNVELEARLIDDMLDLTRIARGKLEIHARPVDLREVLLHAAEACETERKNKWIELVSNIPADLPKIHADGARIQQVIWNVLKNAIKFTPDSGTIQMDARRIGDRIEIRVSDTGVGLQPGMEEKIFTAFEQGGVQVTRHFGGLGLGLAISKALIEAHHGTISAANRTDRKGAVFTITLPATQEVSSPAPAAPAASSATTEGHGRIVLLVEDHYDTRVLIGRLLSRAGFQVIQAQCAAEALTLYRSANVDYIISDLGLPDASGLDLMEQIQAIRPVPAIALSGYGMEHDVQRAHQVGFSRHLTKPVDVTQILEALKSLPELPTAAN